MKTLFRGFLLWFTLLQGENQFPIVLVHGFIGWGPEELGGYPYWGGEYDLETYLELLGFTVFTVSVGPVSSNWERAVETYYQLKGGQVDYGKAHSEKWGIIQKPNGKNYEGFYPQWDHHNPLHFIGHSMGGQTIRMLAHQLSQNFLTDSLNHSPEPSQLLGVENKGWIKSITSISTPHDGTTLSDLVNKSVPFLQNFIVLGAAVGTGYYDFDLQHWGFNRGEKESWIHYFKRMRNHPAWNTKNICAWDLSLDGAQELNTILPAQSDIYYFSFTTSSTHKSNISSHHIPDKNMSLMLRIRSRLIGSNTIRYQDGTSTDASWFENDGVVNTISQSGPTSGKNGADPIAKYRPSEPLIPGQWYVVENLKLDHWKIIGHSKLKLVEKNLILTLYHNHVTRLWELPE